jgi:hypothetical protein
MKKLLFVLLIVAVASYLFVGCLPGGTTPDDGGGGSVVTGITVDVGAVTIDGKDYVKGGTHDIDVTFPAPVANAYVYVTDCTGDYSKALTETAVVLWPNADKTVWSGSVTFLCSPCDTSECVEYTDCCASYIMVEAGECAESACLSYPVIVDCAPPEVDLQIRFLDCSDSCDPCDITAGVYMEFTSLLTAIPCYDPEDCCSDDCSGIASWTMTVGDTLCAEPCDLIPGTGCPVAGESDCCFAYAPDTSEDVCYTITFDIVDKVGNSPDGDPDKTGTQLFTYRVCLDTDEVVSFVKVGVDGLPLDTPAVPYTLVWDPVDMETTWIAVPISGVDCLFPLD